MAPGQPAGKLSRGGHEGRQPFAEGDGEHPGGAAAGGERQRPFAGVPAVRGQVRADPGQLLPRVGVAWAIAPRVDVRREQRPGLLGEGVDARGKPGPEGDLRFARSRAVGQPGHADRTARLPQREQILPQPQPALRSVDRPDRSEHPMIDRGHRQRLPRQVGQQHPHPTHRTPLPLVQEECRTAVRGPKYEELLVHVSA